MNLSSHTSLPRNAHPACLVGRFGIDAVHGTQGPSSKLTTFGGPRLLFALVFLSAKAQAMTGLLAEWFGKQSDQALRLADAVIQCE